MQRCPEINAFRGLRSLLAEGHEGWCKPLTDDEERWEDFAALGLGWAKTKLLSSG